MELLDSEMAMIHPSSNPWLLTNGSTSAITGAEREKFKEELIFYYGVRHADGRVTCMVSGQALKTGDVVAAHIWPAHARDSFAERWFNLSDGALDSARNGIIMAAALEEKFDKLRISFRWDDEVGKFRCVVLNKRLRGKGQNVPGLFHPDGTCFTFSDLDGMELITPPDKVPFRRLLAYHYATALQLALKNQWIEPEAMPDMFSSNEKVVAWLHGHSPNAKWPGVPRYHRHLIAGSSGSQTSSRSKDASSSNVTSVDHAVGK